MKNQYILYVGRVEEKKNLRMLIDAFVLFAKERKKVSLVLAGRNGYGYEMIQQKIKQLPSETQDLIYLPGHLPQYDMVRYLSHATLFAFPSWYEGFGLSALEAMATGVPVVCSDSSALPEVAGDSAVLLPPTKPLSWAAAFSKIINEPKFAQELRTKGLKRAEQFSWSEAARKTLEIIYDAAKR